jgi:hypothetical protein
LISARVSLLAASPRSVPQKESISAAFSSATSSAAPEPACKRPSTNERGASLGDPTTLHCPWKRGSCHGGAGSVLTCAAAAGGAAARRPAVACWRRSVGLARMLAVGQAHLPIVLRPAVAQAADPCSSEARMESCMAGSRKFRVSAA